MNVRPVAGPGQQASASKRVTHVVEARPYPIRWSHLRHSPPQEPVEGVPHSRIEERSTGIRDEEGRIPQSPATGVPFRGIAPERLDDAGVQRHQSRLSELSLSDCQNASIQVDVARFQSKGFTDAQAGASQQPD